MMKQCKAQMGEIGEVFSLVGVKASTVSRSKPNSTQLKLAAERNDEEVDNKSTIF